MVRGWAKGDDSLFQELKASVTNRAPAADRMIEAAKAAFTWRTVDEELELLTLSYDSSLDDVSLVRRQALDLPRTLIFAGETLSVEVEVGDAVLMGQMVPAQAGYVTLMTAQGWFGETEGDDAGFFLLARPGPGPVRLRCHTAGSDLVTDWVVI